jgi:hypothetical protein
MTILFAIGGCAPRQAITATPPSASSSTYDDGDYARVLRDCVQGDRVNYAFLLTHREPLERYLGLISVVGPKSTPSLFPTADDRACFYINAHNACALRAALEQYPTDSIYRLNAPDPDDGYTFRVDRQSMSLWQLGRKLAEAHSGDVRGNLALCAAALGTPTLAPLPYRPDTLNEQLREAIERGARNSDLVRVDHQTREVFIWGRMVDQRQQYIDYHQRVSGTTNQRLLGFLLQFADAATRNQLSPAIQYTERKLPFNRRLNDITAVSTATPPS